MFTRSLGLVAAICCVSMIQIFQVEPMPPIKPMPKKERPQIDPKKLKEEIDQAIKDLGNEDVQVRNKAQDKLIKIGKPALEALKKATEDSDEETKQRAKTIIQEIESVARKAIESYAKDRWPDEEPSVTEIKRNKYIAKFFPKYKFYKLQVGAKNVNMFFGAKDGDDTPIRLGGGNYSTTVPTRLLNLVKESGAIIKSEQDVYDLFDALTDAFDPQHYRYDTITVDKTDYGYYVYDTTFGRYYQIKVDSKGKLTDIEGTKSNYNYNEQNMLTVEKLKLEIQLLKKQLKAMEEKEKSSNQ